jgi:hypothetical protein
LLLWLLLEEVEEVENREWMDDSSLSMEVALPMLMMFV